MSIKELRNQMPEGINPTVRGMKAAYQSIKDELRNGPVDVYRIINGKKVKINIKRNGQTT